MIGPGPVKGVKSGYATVCMGLLVMALLSRMKSSMAAERIEALQALRKLKDVHEDALDPVAEQLLDEAKEVRDEAAVTLTQLVLRLGCKIADFPRCPAFEGILDNTPIPVERPFPKYPRAGLENRTKGAVIVQFLVEEDGSVKEVRALQGGAPFAEAAVEAVSRHRYKPAKRKGREVPFADLLIVDIKLR